MKNLKKNTLKILLDLLYSQIAIVDKDKVIRYANKRFIDEHGKKAVGRECYNVVKEDFRPCAVDESLCPVNKLLDTKEITSRTIHKKGEKDILVEAYRLDSDLYALILNELTGYQYLIKRTKTAEERYKIILDTAPDAIVSIDKDHKIVVFNNAAEKIFGYSKEEIIGKDLNMLVPSYYGDHFSYVKRFLETRKPKIIGKSVVFNAKREDGSEIPVELHISFMEANGEITFTAIIRNVSEQKSLERKLLQSERLAAVGKAVAHVAHEIKNPLMIIGGFSQQIRRHITDKNSLKKIDLILEEVARLERLVANLGDFTKEFRLIKRPSDINLVIKDVLKMMKEIHPEEKYKFVERLSPDIDEVICDPDKIKQVLINIITNAIQAMENGGTVTVATENKDGEVEISIQDEGKGISEEEILHIFEPFYTTRDSGSGLGLAISYKIIEAHKGEIKAISTPSKGTKFIIRLPYC